MIKNCLKFLFFLGFFLLTQSGFSQFAYGVQLQAFSGEIKGSAIADSILVFSDSRASIQFEVPQIIGLFLEYKPKGKLPLILRAEVNYRPQPLGHDISIFNGKSFGGKPTGVYTYKSLNFAFDIPLTLNYILIKRENVPFFKLRNLEISGFAGITVQLQARGERETYPIAINLNSPGISEVNFNLYNTIRTANYFYNYGIRVRLGHFIAIYRRDMLLTPSGTNDLKAWGNTYAYRTAHQYESISLGYTFNLKKKKG
jgi:hypothetical protein